ncbi:MAG: hypothetical protein DRJ40_11675 [Thermoprotei archaeon]|nr:MAG: hypothetical protein DRJ40_11675 [Thermoprotei archaeon]
MSGTAVRGSCARFRRFISWQVINDYVVQVLNKSTPLFERVARAETLPFIVHSILLRLEETREGKRVREGVKRGIDVVKAMGIELPPLRDEQKLSEWYVEAVKKRDNEDYEEWLRRVALTSMLVLGEAVIARGEIEVSEPQPFEF